MTGLSKLLVQIAIKTINNKIVNSNTLLIDKQTK